MTKEELILKLQAFDDNRTILERLQLMQTTSTERLSLEGRHREMEQEVTVLLGLIVAIRHPKARRVCLERYANGRQMAEVAHAMRSSRRTCYRWRDIGIRDMLQQINRGTNTQR